MKPVAQESLLSPADWSFPIPIAYGPGRLRELGDLCRSAGMKRPLLVTDRGSRELPFVDEGLSYLQKAGLAAEVFSDVAPNPTDNDAKAGRDCFRDGGHDGVVAIGGGSGMDAGKAISLTAGHDTPLWDFDYDVDSPTGLGGHHFAPLVCVPTTAGTGAETESTAMVTDTASGMKRCVWHPLHRPATAILDPQLTVGLPANMTAWTGVDAMVHAVEAYSVSALHPLCDGLALEALRLITDWLPRSVDDGTNLEARGAMLIGSCLGGIAFLKGLGLVHAMSHMVGAVYDTHHGLTNAVLLPIVLRTNRESISHKVGPMSAAMGLTSTDFDGFYAAVTGLLDELAIPVGLADIGVDSERLPELAVKSSRDAAAATNPKQLSVDEIEGLLAEALIAAR